MAVEGRRELRLGIDRWEDLIAGLFVVFLVVCAEGVGRGRGRGEREEAGCRFYLYSAALPGSCSSARIVLPNVRFRGRWARDSHHPARGVDHSPAHCSPKDRLSSYSKKKERKKDYLKGLFITHTDVTWTEWQTATVVVITPFVAH